MCCNAMHVDKRSIAQWMDFVKNTYSVKIFIHQSTRNKLHSANTSAHHFINCDLPVWSQGKARSSLTRSLRDHCTDLPCPAMPCHALLVIFSLPLASTEGKTLDPRKMTQAWIRNNILPSSKHAKPNEREKIGRCDGLRKYRK